MVVLRHSVVKMVIIFLVTFMTDSQWFGFVPLLPPVIDQFTLTYGQAGFLMSIVAVAFIVVSLLAGFLQDRAYATRFFAFGLVLTVLGTGLRGLAVDFNGFFLAHIILGAGVGFVWAGVPKYIASWFPPGKRGVPTALYAMGWPMGAIFAFTVTPWVFEILGDLSLVFFVNGAWSLGVAALWLGLAPFQETAQDEIEKSSHSILRQFRTVLGNRQIWLLGILYTCVTGIFAGVTTWLPTILVERGVALVFSGAMAAVVPAGFAIGSLVFGKVSERLPRRSPLVYISGLITIPALVGTILLESAPLVAATFILGLSFGFLPLLYLMAMEHANLRSNVAGAAGVITGIGTLGAVMMPVAIGVFKDLTGDFTGGQFSLLLLAVAIPILGFAIKEKHQPTDGTR